MRLFIIIYLLFSVAVSVVQGQELYPAYDKNGYYGYKNSSGEFYVRPIFVQAFPYSEGLARVRVATGKKGIDSVAYLSSLGGYAFSRKFIDGYDYSGGYAAVKSDSGWIYIDKEGLTASNLVYEEATSFSSGFSVVKYQGKWGIIDSRFRFIFPPVYEHIGWPDSKNSAMQSQSFFIDGLVAFSNDGLWGILSNRGKIVSEAIYDYVSRPSETLMRVKKSDDWNYINAKGKLISIDWFYDAYDFSEGLAGVRVHESKKIGFINSKGKKVIDDVYDQLFWSFNGGLAIAGRKNDTGFLCGVISKKGNVVVPFEFTEADEIYKSIIPLKDQQGLWHFFNKDGQKVCKTGFHQYFILRNRFAVQKDGKWGLMALNGEFETPIMYRGIYNKKDEILVQNYNQWMISKGKLVSDKIFSADSLVVSGRILLKFLTDEMTIEGVESKHFFGIIPDLTSKGHPDFLIVKSGKKYGVLRSDGTFLLPASYNSVHYDSSGFFIAKGLGIGKESLHYVICVDTAGKKIIETNALETGSWSEGYINIRNQGGLWGFFDKSGTLVIPNKYIEASPFHNGFSRVLKLENDVKVEGLIDTSNCWYDIEKIGAHLSIGQSIKNISGYSEVLKLNEHVLSLKTEKGYQLSDTALKVLQPVNFKNIFTTEEGLVVGIYKEEAAVFSAKGVRKYSFQHGGDELYNFCEQFARIKKGRYYGYIDMEGRLRITPQYDSAQDFSEGLAAVMINSKWGFINKEEKFIIQPRYAYATSFKNGLSLVQEGNKWNFIDSQGKLLNSSFYDEIISTDKGKWLLRLKGKIGLADEDGYEIITCRYDFIKDTGKAVIIGKDDKFGVLDYDQNFIFDLVYDEIRFNEHSGEFLLMKKGLTEKFVPEKDLNK